MSYVILHKARLVSLFLYCTVCMNVDSYIIQGYSK